MDKEELNESMGYISSVLDDALGMAQPLEEEFKEDERFSNLCAMIEEAMDYCNDLWDSL